MTLLERFLQYIHFMTTSDEASATCPSSSGQLDLGHYLVQELQQIGLLQVKMDANGYVYGMLPATPGDEANPAIGFIAHMDTSPDFSGENPKPQILENYDGEDVLLKGSGAVLKVSEFPELKNWKGRTLITTDGTTLLGADDKAGIAEIVTAMEMLVRANQDSVQIHHGEIWVCFTPDEEIGRGTEHFGLNLFPATFAYTVDGGDEREIASENFNAATAIFEIKGKSVHPGDAKGIMKNAALMAAEIAMALPKNETPAMTEGREGFYHLVQMEGDVSSAKLVYIVRDHDQKQFAIRCGYLQKLAEIFNSKYGGTAENPAVLIRLKHSYRNMRPVLEKHPEILERARRAILNAGLEPVDSLIRGGTDGALLSYQGLPCPNLGTGGYGFHGPFEHISVEGMETVVQIILNIVKC